VAPSATLVADLQTLTSGLRRVIWRHVSIGFREDTLAHARLDVRNASDSGARRAGRRHRSLFDNLVGTAEQWQGDLNAE
jgi:hypothetical protein